jgi:hypothetical protein
LYAYLESRTKEILYIGMARYARVAERMNCRAKYPMWEYLEKERGIFECNALVGKIELEGNGRLSAQLLEAIESLLIICERPCANVRSIVSRTPSPGLCVKCVGQWPGQGQVYFDNDGTF